MLLYSAPLQGITTWVYRTVHSRLFGGADRYFTPFFSPTKEHLFTPRELRELQPEHNAGLPVVPQIMARNPADFLWAAEALAAMGYEEVNLNLGCPSGTVSAKGKGAGFLARPEELERFFETVFSAAPPVRISVKTRLGIRDPEEFPRLLELYESYDVSELIIHPRLQRDGYGDPVRPEAFAAAYRCCRLPLCYNGDLARPEDFTALEARFPTLPAAMAGRGLAADPALFRKLRGGGAAGRRELQTYTQTLYRAYCESYGSAGPAAQRMKEQWAYLIRRFAGGERYAGKMRRIDRPGDYETLEARIFGELPLAEEAGAPENRTGAGTQG
ncbi:MAG: tRNA-dihydrouridine synthase family protein [Oscillibacter sp.]|jgi:tRNA-dihydrouridine synthase|nr:tRNA-dihydrouridine synthase family protein [Oscillibacter sp.]